MFYTNYDSRKAGEMDGTQRAALLFYWPSFERQVRIEGAVSRVRGRGVGRLLRARGRSRAGGARTRRRRAAPIDSREALEAACRRGAQPQHGDAVPRPACWGGYRVSPDAFEFWQGRENRLHDRLAYTFATASWRRQRLAP